MELLAQFHPKIVHFPIALLLTYTLLETLGTLLRKELLTNGAFIILILGFLAAFAAVFTGNRAAMVAEKWDEIGTQVIPAIPFKMIREHEEWANTVFWYFAGVLVLRICYVIKIQVKGKYPQYLHKAKYVFAVLALIGSFFIYKVGDAGGNLVYKKGVGTDLIKPAEE